MAHEYTIRTGLNILGITQSAVAPTFSVYINPLTGLLTYATASTGTTIATSSFFTQNGNSFTETASIGTNDNFNLQFKTNNSAKMIIATSGNVSIGPIYVFDSTQPDTLRIVQTSSVLSENIIGAYSNMNDFTQINIQNISTGSNAQSGFNATLNTGTATGGFLWMGINNTGYNAPQNWNIGSASDATILASTNDFWIGNSNANKAIIFGVPTTSSPFFREVMRIAGTSGNIGIGYTAPSYPLDVRGYARVSSIVDNVGSTGLSGYILTATTNGLIWSPSPTFSFVQGGNSFGGTALIGINDNFNLQFETNNTNRMIIGSAGNIGIGNATPSYLLDVTGYAKVLSIVDNQGKTGPLGYVLTATTSGLVWSPGVTGPQGFQGFQGSAGVAGGGMIGYVFRCIASQSVSGLTGATSTYLQFTMSANESWKFQAHLTVYCQGAGGMKYSISAPTGATMEAWLYSSTTALTTLSYQRMTTIGMATYTSTAVHTTAALIGNDRIEGILQNGATPGTFSINFASVTTGITSSIFPNSSLMVQRTTA